MTIQIRACRPRNTTQNIQCFTLRNHKWLFELITQMIHENGSQRMKLPIQRLFLCILNQMRVSQLDKLWFNERIVLSHLHVRVQSTLQYVQLLSLVHELPLLLTHINNFFFLLLFIIVVVFEPCFQVLNNG
ncbi:hypothetical protein D3C80_1716160 [compost metagenome]